MAIFNPEASSFDPVLIVPPTAFDIAYMSRTSRPRAASEPGPLARDELAMPDLPNGLWDTPLPSCTSSLVGLETRESCWSAGQILYPFQESGQLTTDPPCAPMIYPGPEQMHRECDPMFCYPDLFCLPPPALPMEPISEVAYASHPSCSNTMSGYDPNTHFPVPGPSHLIMQRVFDRMYVDDTTYPGFTVLTDGIEEEQEEDDKYVIFGLNHSSEYTDFGRAMVAKHAVPRLNSFHHFQGGPATFDGGEWDLEAQQYQHQDHAYFCESTEPKTYDTKDFDSLPAVAQAAESSLNPKAPDFSMDVNDVALPGVRTPSLRLRLAMQPLVMRAKRFSIKEEDLNLGRISWVDRSSWFPEPTEE